MPPTSPTNAPQHLSPAGSSDLPFREDRSRRALFRFSFLLLMFAALFPRLARAEESAEEARAIWKTIYEKVGNQNSVLNFDNFPETFYPKLAPIAEKVKAAFALEPTREEMEKWWASRGGKPDELEGKKEAVKMSMNRYRFYKEHADVMKELVKANMSGVFRKMVANGDADGKARACLICIPLPCPNDDTFKEAASFMDQACQAAQANKDKKLQVVIVRGPYGQKANLKRAEEGAWWWEEISSFPKRYEAAIKDGVAKLVDGMPGSTSTPWGYLFRDGELVTEGNIALWSQDPLILQDFAR